MRLKFGRPSLSRYASRFCVPQSDQGLSVTFLGTSTLLFDDGESAVLFDGFFSRPALRRVVFGRIAADLGRIDAALGRLGFGPGARRLDAVVPVHSHYDHVLDSAAVIARAGGLLVGGESSANVGRGAGLGSNGILVVASGETTACGAFTLLHLSGEHCPPDRFPGHIRSPVVPPARARDYKCGDTWSIFITHVSGRTALVQGSAGFVPDALVDKRAEVAYLSVGQLGVRPDQYIRDYWTHTIDAVGARRAVLTHWDDFFRRLDAPLRALPYAGDDLDVTITMLAKLAGERRVDLTLPTLWRREDPWAGLNLNPPGLS